MEVPLGYVSQPKIKQGTQSRIAVLDGVTLWVVFNVMGNVCSLRSWDDEVGMARRRGGGGDFGWLLGYWVWGSG